MRWASLARDVPRARHDNDEHVLRTFLRMRRVRFANIFLRLKVAGRDRTEYLCSAVVRNCV